IVSTSQPQNPWSLGNFLLYTSIAISILAIFTSIVFLAVDYMRRLLIDSAQSQGYRLVLNRRKIEKTGLGASLIFLTVLLLFLYLSVILKAKDEVADNTALLIERVTSCATVLLYFFNLRSLCESPKVQFHTTCKNMAGTDVQEFLESRSFREGGDLWNTFAAIWGRLAGEDLELFLKKGSRDAFFPRQSSAPLLHVVCAILFFGAMPCLFQLGTSRLFVQPEILDLKAVSATLMPSFVPVKHGRSLRLLLGAERSADKKAAIGTPEHPYLLLLDANLAGLTVSPKFSHTTSIGICCDSSANCSSHSFKHSLLKFDDKPAVLRIPANATTNCRLMVQGLSSHAVTEICLRVEVMRDHHFCKCSDESCQCCDGYAGHFDLSSWPAQEVRDSCTEAACTEILHTNSKAGPSCACGDGYIGTIRWNGPKPSGHCTPAPCSIQHSNLLAGQECGCEDGYAGEISWQGGTARGVCEPAPCNITNSNKNQSHNCACLEGYLGNISWKGPTAHGQCEPISCESVANSHRQGSECKCKDGYLGRLRLNGVVAQGTCEPVPCNIGNSTGAPGPACKCKFGFYGRIVWAGWEVTGGCTAMPCFDSLGSNGRDGSDCGCKDGFNGSVIEKKVTDDSLMVLHPNCEPAVCDIENSNKEPGPNCRCSDSYTGWIGWNGTVPIGRCEPAECNITNSNMKLGKECACNYGFFGEISWVGPIASGECTARTCYGSLGSNQIKGPDCGCTDEYVFHSIHLYYYNSWSPVCEPAPCTIENSTKRPGPNCRCSDGYNGTIRFKKGVAEGSCHPASCDITNSNRKLGTDCACKYGFYGSILWDGPEANGECIRRKCRQAEGSNLKDGPECGCKDGFAGETEEVDTPTCEFAHAEDRRSQCREFWIHEIWPTCEPAPCRIENSNGAAGPKCGCQDGYSGAIIWNGSRPEGSCQPSICNIPFSNQAPGPACQCLDGFGGQVRWRGAAISGECVPSACQIEHSDYGPGTSCQCSEGFYGTITWNGTIPTGKCLPLPMCSEDIYMVGALKEISSDSDNRCKTGQSMLAHGFVCDKMAGFIQWDLAESLPHTANCKSLQLNSSCGGLLQNLDLPNMCRKSAAKPNCAPRIEYTVTTKIGGYSCNEKPQEDRQLVTFVGQQCGYDLIKWASMSTSKGCVHNFSLACGSTPPGEELPNSCTYAAEPAVFNARSSLSKDGATSMFKMFSSGKFAVSTGALASRHAQVPRPVPKMTWHSDGTYLSLQYRSGDQRIRQGYKVAGLDGSQFNGSAGQQLLAAWHLPVWWTSRFQPQLDMPSSSFDADKLSGCRLAFEDHWYNYSFTGTYGQELWGRYHSYWTRYTYVSSAAGFQTYRSKMPCLPVAAFFEILLMVANVETQGAAEHYSAQQSSCRILIRVVLNAESKVASCKNVYEEAFIHPTLGVET
ncbi:unnamed protein product, partial [Symbiodinium microadriaticum]